MDAGDYAAVRQSFEAASSPKCFERASQRYEADSDSSALSMIVTLLRPSNRALVQRLLSTCQVFSVSKTTFTSSSRASMDLMKFVIRPMHEERSAECAIVGAVVQLSAHSRNRVRRP